MSHRPAIIAHREMARANGEILQRQLDRKIGVQVSFRKLHGETMAAKIWISENRWRPK